MVNQTTIGRRAFLSGALALGAMQARAQNGPRLAAVDWAMLETALALGITPVSACELVRFRADARHPAVPEETVDLGLRSAPNFELLQLTRPDLVLTSPWYAQIEPRLSAIAPVMSHGTYLPGEAPWPHAVAALHAVGARTGHESAAREVEAGAEAEIAALSAQLAALRDRPLYAIEIGDARHFRAFGPDSMFGNMLSLLGVENAWDAPTEYSFAAPLPMERLSERPDARILAVGGIPTVARRGLRNSVLWNRLPPVAAGRFATLPPVNAFGGVPAGLRFARLLTDTLAPGATA
ncbi:ABC transporter substrate-binding protein [Allosediminivita pacifica]|uniref:Iron complex transport system substrate-binding protein n=1 Tax=Allosediminivita pacifica TaxID=1267769 RepID=A0A2T6AJN5_9RHOB|nr:ABC transporter substrate-binding protein [Allosediminivita pacifica]PTX43976.1 iron complex transport system substrate-binding protein [Allosediminivita pacifica]GGB21220.1 amino acid ABC transporter substrate-binding protein [Allosediminivita pacifica]